MTNGIDLVATWQYDQEFIAANPPEESYCRVDWRNTFEPPQKSITDEMPKCVVDRPGNDPGRSGPHPATPSLVECEPLQRRGFPESRCNSTG